MHPATMTYATEIIENLHCVKSDVATVGLLIAAIEAKIAPLLLGLSALTHLARNFGSTVVLCSLVEDFAAATACAPTFG